MCVLLDGVDSIILVSYYKLRLPLRLTVTILKHAFKMTLGSVHDHNDVIRGSSARKAVTSEDASGQCLGNVPSRRCKQ